MSILAIIAIFGLGVATGWNLKVAAILRAEGAKMKPTEVGSTMEQFREQGYENLVVNKRIDPTKNWGIAVADKDYNPELSLGQDVTKQKEN